MSRVQIQKRVIFRVKCRFLDVSKVSAGNSGQRLTPDTQHISAMNKSLGLRLKVVKHLPLGHLQTKNELTALSHCDAGRRFVLKTRAKTLKKLG